MKWKDADNGKEEKIDKSDPYYEDDGYASYTDKTLAPGSGFSGRPLFYKKPVVIVVAALVVVAVFLLISKLSQPASSQKTVELEQKIAQLEVQLEKFEGVDEKVTRIWEQAKTFETFKTRFDRTEASISLRMDHFAMSLDTLQKKTDKTMAAVEKMQKTQARKRAPAKVATSKKAVSGRTHTVASGDTLYNISRKYNLSVDELKAINKLETGAVIHVGQKLKVSR